MTYFSLLADRKLEEAETFRKEQIPKKLIKFISLGSSDTNNEKKFRTLSDRKLWLCTTKMLNDPYDFQCMYLNKRIMREKNYPDEIISLFENQIIQQNSKWALASFSSNGFDCLPMWAYYTNNYKGYCVEYIVSKPDMIYRVGYEPERIEASIIVMNLYQEWIKSKAAEQTSNVDLEFFARLFLQQFFLKHISWKHENEYRIVYPIDEDNCPDGVGLNVDLEKVGLKTNRIVAGLYCSQDHRMRLNDISNQLGCGDISDSKLFIDKYALLEDTNNE